MSGRGRNTPTRNRASTTPPPSSTTASPSPNRTSNTRFMKTLSQSVALPLPLCPSVLLVRRLLLDEPLDAVGRCVVLEPRLGERRLVLEVLRRRPAVLLCQAQADEQVLRAHLPAEQRVV